MRMFAVLMFLGCVWGINGCVNTSSHLPPEHITPIQPTNADPYWFYGNPDYPYDKVTVHIDPKTGEQYLAVPDRR